LPRQEYGTLDQVFKTRGLYIETGSQQARAKPELIKENNDECHCK